MIFIPARHSCGKKNVNNLRFADDIDLIGESLQYKTCNRLYRQKRFGLRINEKIESRDNREELCDQMKVKLEEQELVYTGTYYL